MGNDDTPELNYKDTIQAGCSFHNEEEVMGLVQNGPEMIRLLQRVEVLFDRNGDGKI